MNNSLKQDIIDFDNKLEDVLYLKSEAVSNIMLITKLNDEQTAMKIIKENYIIISKEDLMDENNN